MKALILTAAMLEKLKNVFARHDGAELFVTSDGQIFYKQNDANGQAGNLRQTGKSAEVLTVTREDLQEEEPVKEPSSKEVLAALLDAQIAEHATIAAKIAAKKEQIAGFTEETSARTVTANTKALAALEEELNRLEAAIEQTSSEIVALQPEELDGE